MVLFEHFVLRGLKHDGINLPFVQQAWFGVYLFFVLSGFVLYLPYARGSREMESMNDARTFLQHRAQRLLPLFYISFFVIFLLHHKTPAGSAHFFEEFLGVPTFAFMLTQSGFYPPADGVLWSLGVEVMFSMIFPALIFRRGSISPLMIGASLAISLAVGYLFVHFQYRPLITPGCLFDFVIGMVAADVVVSGRQQSRLLPLVSALMIIAGLGLGRNTMLYPIMHEIFSAGCAAMVVVLAKKQNLLRSALEIWPLRIVGVMCFSVYVWHVAIFQGLYPWGDNMSLRQVILALPILLPSIGLVSALSYRYIEFGKSRDVRALFLLSPRRATESLDVAKTTSNLRNA
jgi:peptidoglycan/LPS O-acetylase OafA/YrhL